MSEITELAESVNGLNAMAETLTASADALAASSKAQDKVLKRIEALAKDQEALTAYGRRNRVSIQVGVIGLAMSLAAGGFAINLAFRLSDTTNQLQTVQTRTSTEVLCPLFQLFALSLTTNPVPPNYTPEQLGLRRRYETSINDGLSKLGCPKLS